MQVIGIALWLAHGLHIGDLPFGFWLIVFRSCYLGLFLIYKLKYK